MGLLRLLLALACHWPLLLQLDMFEMILLRAVLIIINCAAFGGEGPALRDALLAECWQAQLIDGLANTLGGALVEVFDAILDLRRPAALS